ncbi:MULTISPECIES: membrane protein insertase YidC [unclassified Aureispira]|uniref:membrane protein insertase YidC n=1 Tax=unclassified Aureispira TaxID=2649989 RepID=UPI0006967BE8|nr:MULTISPECIES: membrane protein insertase YidC [unclassified Aureispira]WMX16471.1 membrane protein insertase YidC [Aureispira sp. CCB-E]
MKSNNSTFTGIMLLVLLWLTYSILTGPTKEEIEQQQQEQAEAIRQQEYLDSLTKAEQQQAELKVQQIQKDTTLTDEQKDSVQQQLQKDLLGNQYGIFTSAAIGSEEQATLENEKLKITFNTKGGSIAKVEVKGFLQYDHTTEDPYDKEPLVLMDNPNNRFSYYIPLTGASKGDISTGDLYFEPILEGNTLKMRAYADDKSQYIEQKYTINDNYVLDYQLNLEGINTSMPRNKNIVLDWYTYVRKIEKNPHYEKTMTTVYYKNKEDGFDYCDCRTTNEEQLDAPVQWVSQSQQFFNASLFAQEGTTFKSANVGAYVVDDKEEFLKILDSKIEIATRDQKSAAYDMQFYIGPNDYNELVTMGNEFERIIPFGWSIFGFISRSVIRPLFNFFALFISNYGIIILLLTLLIRLALFPLQYKMILNGVKMGVMKPEMEAMRAKYKDDPAGMQAAQMKMYQEYGLNPLGGCLPMLLTMPIWIALYRFFPSSISFRQESFLWADDLVSYDSILDFGYIPFIYDIYGDHVSLFTLLWMLSMFAFLWYNSKQMDMSAAAGGGANMKMMKYMQFAFPVLFFFALNSWAAGLTAYMLFSNLLNIAQTFITKNVLINKDKLREELLEKKRNYKEQPGGKKGFMAKYQELLAEQQKEMERQKKKGKK